MNGWRLLSLIALLTVVAWVDAAQSAAQDHSGESQPAFVYGINAAIPGNFVGTFAPPTATTIYLMAGETSVISPRMTEIYFWPITDEFRANWSLRNDRVPGTLEITQGNATVAETAATDYTIQFTQQEGATSAQIYLGQEAIDADTAFQQRQDAFQKASHDYYDAERAWLDAVDKINTQQHAAAEAQLPPEPKAPDPVGIYSNGLNKGIPIDLEPGRYSIRLRDSDGATV